jgi:hypothetical protein
VTAAKAAVDLGQNRKGCTPSGTTPPEAICRARTAVPAGRLLPAVRGPFPVESLSQLPEFDFNGLVKSFEDAIRLLGLTVVRNTRTEASTRI